MASNLTLEKFNCIDESESLSTKWHKWKRAFQIHIEASNILEQKTKLNYLLHMGGFKLQEIYDSIPEAKGSGNVDEKVYDIAIKALDEYFIPKFNLIFERHLFRQIKQDENESFEKFVDRLKNQSEKCNFTDRNEHIIDQIMENCKMKELRKKILLLSNQDIDLNKIISYGNLLEAVNRQLKTNETCTRCGNKYHTPNYKKCPALDKRCLQCGYMGHFKKLCRTKKRKIN